MKVLHLMTHLDSGGITHYILNLVSPLARRDCHTYVYSDKGELSGSFEAAGAFCVIARVRTKSELDPKLYAALRPLVKLIRHEQIDLLHAHNRPSQILAHWASRLSGVPYVTTCHGFYKRRLGRRLLPAWGKRTIAISEGVASHLKEYFRVPERNIDIVPNGVPIEKLKQSVQHHKDAKHGLGLPEDALVISCIARLVKVKGQEDLIRAFVSIHERFPKCRLVLAGDGEERKPFEELVSSLGMREKVLFTGNIRDISSVLAATDIFVHPASWKEAFGLSIIEAMVCGIPAIVSDGWALKNHFEDGESVLYVPPASPEVLAEKLSTLIQSPQMRSELGRKGQSIACENFSLEKMADGIIASYKLALTPQVG